MKLNSLSKKETIFNSGILLSKAKTLKKYLSEYAHYLFEPVEYALLNSVIDLDFCRLDEKHWEKCPSISIDYALMEKLNNLLVIRYDGYWNDMGNWEAIWRDTEKNIENTAIIGTVTQKDCKNSLLISANKKMELVALGLHDLIVISDTDSILVADKNRSNDVKILVDELVNKDKQQGQAFPKMYRPWGFFETLLESEIFKVKLITVKPKSRLSLQSHRFRAEHWVVVKGSAVVTLEKEEIHLTTSQSIYIPQKQKHRLQNRTDNLLSIIEVQTGSYFGEDDIIRYEDDYSRLF